MKPFKLLIAVCLLLTLAAIVHTFVWPPKPTDAIAEARSEDRPASADRPAAGPKGERTMVRIKVFNKSGQLVGPVESPKLTLTDAEWKKRLKPEQFAVLRSSATERPFCGVLLDNKQTGVYTCAGCGLPLFSSDAKFHSGTGWPSFFQPVAKENVAERPDHSHGTTRTEINCARCDGHLGHVFDDGPRPTGLRFCLNSASLNFTPSDKLGTLADPAAEKWRKVWHALRNEGRGPSVLQPRPFWACHTTEKAPPASATPPAK